VTQKPDANALAVERTDWALERTFMAADRTLMAWVRTAISMIGFGFIAVIQDWHHTKRLQGEHHRRPFNLSLVVAGLVALIGVFTFTSVLLRIGPF
jgi:putative membrane protein